MDHQQVQVKRRTRKTRPSVILLDHVSRGIITIGGIGIILAVSLVFVFLASVVAPLFQQGSATFHHSVTLFPGAKSEKSERWSFIEVDSFHALGIHGLLNERYVQSFFFPTGQPLDEYLLFEQIPRTFTYNRETGTVLAGFEDGSTQAGRIIFNSRYLNLSDLEEGGKKLPDKGIFLWEGKAALKTQDGQLRVQEVSIEMEKPIKGYFREPVVLIDRVDRPSGPIVAGYYANEVLFLRSVTKKTNLLTGEETLEVEEKDIKVPVDSGKGIPHHFFLLGSGDMAFLLWKDGNFLRLDLNLPVATGMQGGEVAPASPAHLEEAKILEKGNLFSLLPASKKDQHQAQITSAVILLGRGTIVTGDTVGRVCSWHLGRTGETLTLINSHLFQHHSEVTSIVPSTRKRLLAIGYKDGSSRVVYLTSERVLAEVKVFPNEPIERVLLAPKDDGLGGWGENGTFAFYTLKEGQPEFSLKALFTPILYEGNAEKEHVWQSSSGTDSFEPKFGLIPLIFGTLKATFYSLLFGVPIALLAAIYTSEFLHPDLRARIKPLIEMMASLPSVVLGFLAALVIAPYVENRVPTIILSLYCVPFTFFLSGYVVQLFPKRWFVLSSRFQFYILLAISLPTGIVLSIAGGPLLERVLFYGDLKSWLDGQKGQGSPGWFLLLLPIAVLAGGLVIHRVTQIPWIRTWIESLEKRKLSPAAVDSLKMVASGLFSVVVAIGVSLTLDRIGVDPRNSFPLVGRLLGTYVQRNSLVVGFLMGFAIIPIIYTIADDALKSVPNSLRAGALSLGATPWQTTVRVVIPTAMSGLFSAVMIGFGRAVGETMIVLMATGNTPIMEWNPFNGFRTLSANIAVELPEAVVGSTHYRILFLAALTLFIITFLVNTIAEIQRMRFRTRSYQL